jgi:hypothetical protein
MAKCWAAAWLELAGGKLASGGSPPADPKTLSSMALESESNYTSPLEHSIHGGVVLYIDIAVNGIIYSIKPAILILLAFSIHTEGNEQFVPSCGLHCDLRLVISDGVVSYAAPSNLMAALGAS